MSTTGLQEFKRVLRDFREVGSLVVKGAVAAPLINLWAKFGPPPSGAVSSLTSAAELLAVIWVFHFWYSSPRTTLNRRMKISARLFCVGLIASGLLLELFTDRPNPHSDAVVHGCVLRPEIKKLIAATPGYDPIKALQEGEYDPTKVWTAESIAGMHVLIIAIWVSTFVSVGIFISTFILLQRRRSIRGPRS